MAQRAQEYNIRRRKTIKIRVTKADKEFRRIQVQIHSIALGVNDVGKDSKV